MYSIFNEEVAPQARGSSPIWRVHLSQGDYLLAKTSVLHFPVRINYILGRSLVREFRYIFCLPRRGLYFSYPWGKSVLFVDSWVSFPYSSKWISAWPLSPYYLLLLSICYLLRRITSLARRTIFLTKCVTFMWSILLGSFLVTLPLAFFCSRELLQVPCVSLLSSYRLLDMLDPTLSVWPNVVCLSSYTLALSIVVDLCL